MKRPATKLYRWLMKIEINKPSINAIKGTNFFGVLKYTFIS